MVSGFLVDALGFVLLLLLDPESPYWMALPAFILMPGGMGTGIPAMIGAMLGSVERARSGIAAAMFSAVLLVFMAAVAFIVVPGRVALQ